MPAPGRLDPLAAPRGRVRADGRLQGDVPPGAGRLAARGRAGAGDGGGRAPGGRRRPQPAPRDRSGAVQAPAGGAARGARVRSAGRTRGAPRGAAHDRGGGQGDRDHGRQALQARRLALAPRALREDAALLGARGRRPGDGEPGGRADGPRGAARRLGPRAGAEPGAAEPLDRGARRRRAAGVLRADRAALADADGAAAPVRRGVPSPRLARAAAPGRLRSGVLQRRAAGSAGPRAARQRALHAREPAPAIPAADDAPRRGEAARARGLGRGRRAVRDPAGVRHAADRHGSRDRGWAA